MAKSPTQDPSLAEPLQQIDRTSVLYRGRKLSYFAGCDYYRLASHPVVLDAIRDGLERFGLNVAASRKTTGNHPIYGKLEFAIARFFKEETALLVSNGYMTNLAVGQALAGEFTHALIDERSHGCLFDAARLLGCPIREFRHRDAASARTIARQLGPEARTLLLTDGLFSHSGEVAPLDGYLRLLPRTTTFLVDEAHSAGVLGRHGRGTLEHFGITGAPVVRTVTLSKAFGVYGGAILGSAAVRQKIIERSRLFVGNTPLPLPLAAGALASLRLLKSDAGFRHRLFANVEHVRSSLRKAGLAMKLDASPIIPILPRDPADAAQLKRALFSAGIYPPFINYLGGPRDGYFRFAISSEHSTAQVAALAEVLSSHVKSSAS